MIRGIHIRRIFFAFIGLIACLWVAWLAIPQSLISKYAQDLLTGSRIHVDLSGVKKGFFYTLHIERITITRASSNSISDVLHSQTVICTVQDTTVSPDGLSLLKLSPLFYISGKINGGAIHGTYGGVSQGMYGHFSGKDIQPDGLPILEYMGIHGSGNLAFNLHWQNDKGEMTFSIDDADLRGEFGGIRFVPLNLFNRIKGALALSDTTTLNPISLEGKGIYVRVKGTIRKQSLDGTMEVMMDSSLDQYALFQAILRPYEISPGNYLIPIHQVF